MRLLLVDDESGIREGLATLLRRRGLEVFTADDCRTAADGIRRHAPDVVVTDWRLPDGRAALFVGSCESPVVVISGHPEEVERGAAVREVLAKPVTPAHLIEVVTRCVAAPDSGQPSLSRDVQAIVDRVLQAGQRHRCRHSRRWHVRDCAR